MKPIIPIAMTCAALGTFLFGARTLEAQHAPVSSEMKGVVELFTSQGCSSCPPADVVLGKLAGRQDVLALSLPVDYWDYLGWKDTLALPGNTARQKAYAQARGDGQVYTPQAVINGQVHVNGASESQIEGALRKVGFKTGAGQVSVTVVADKDGLLIEASGGLTAPGISGASVPKGTLLLAAVQKHVEVAIGRGENQGRKVAYTNVVRRLKPIGEWSGKPVSVRVARADCQGEGVDFCAVMLQSGSSGPIVAAARIQTN